MRNPTYARYAQFVPNMAEQFLRQTGAFGSRQTEKTEAAHMTACDFRRFPGGQGYQGKLRRLYRRLPARTALFYERRPPLEPYAVPLCSPCGGGLPFRPDLQ